MLPSCAASFNLPSLPCIPPPSISEILLNALPIFLRSIFRRSFSLGQSTSTWTTVSLAPHSHLSFSWRPCHLPCVASHEWPVRSCVSRYARLRGSGPYIRRVRIEGRVASIWRRCPPFLDAFHSCPYSSRILRRMYPFSRERRCWKGCSLSVCTVRLRPKNRSAAETRRRTITRETAIAPASLDVALLFALRTLRGWRKLDIVNVIPRDSFALWHRSVSSLLCVA
jgi:hypothetical protein